MKAIPVFSNRFVLSALCTGLLLCQSRMFADAWTQPAGHGQVIVFLTGSQISQAFDQSGKIQPFGYGGKFQQLNLNPYFEYGLNDATTWVVNAFIPALRFSNQYGSQSSFGFGDVETGVRRRLNSSESRRAVSAQLIVKFAPYSVDRDPLPGNHQVDVEGRFMVGQGFEIGRRHSFVSVAAAYRYRYGPPADQIRTDATWGIDLNHRFMLLTQYSGITSMRNGSPITVTTNPNLQSDFDLYKGQISMVARVARRTRLQWGWIDAFAGRNTGHGETLLLALWQDF